MKFYYNDKNNDVSIEIFDDYFCCEHMKKDWYDENLTFKCMGDNKIKIFAYSERLARLLTECPFCHEKIITEVIKDGY